MSTNTWVVPEGERYGPLKGLLFDYVDIVARIEGANQGLARQWPEFFLFLVYPWILDRGQVTQEQRDFLERRKSEVGALGFDGEKARKQLEAVIAGDKHLADCCPTPLHLVNFLNTFFIKAAAAAKREGQVKSGSTLHTTNSKA